MDINRAWRWKFAVGIVGNLLTKMQLNRLLQNQTGLIWFGLFLVEKFSKKGIIGVYLVRFDSLLFENGQPKNLEPV